MKNIKQKALSLLLSLSLVLGLTALPVRAADTAETRQDELVYVLSGADGAVGRVLVSDWLSGENSDTVQNTERSKAEHLPVKLTVSYKLNGKTMSPGELSGKSGKLTMRFDYENTTKSGKQTMAVPVAAITGILLDREVFRNVQVKNGKLLDDGSRSLVLGVALPGLQKNLQLSKQDVDLPEYLELTADVQNFRMAETFTLVTSEPFIGLDVDSPDFVAELKSGVSQMGDAARKLIDGSDQLSQGLRELLEKSNELSQGVQALSDGAQQLKNGASELTGGAQSLSEGAASLCGGLDTLNSKSDTLVGGAQQVFSTLLSAANQQLAAAGVSAPQLTMGNYAQVLSGLIAALDPDAVYAQALEQVTAGVEAKRPEIQAAVTQAVTEQVQAKVSAAVREQVTQAVTAEVHNAVAEQVIFTATEGTMTKEQYDAAVEAGQVPEELQMQVEAAIEAQMGTEPVLAKIGQAVDAQMAGEEVQGLIAAKSAETMASDEIAQTIAENTEVQVQKAIADTMASPEVQGQLSAAAEGAKSLIALKTSLDSYNAFYGGIVQYTKGVGSALDGAQKLTAGAAAVQEGTAKLYSATGSLAEGIGHLNSSTPALIAGITGLKDGEETLLDGLQQFYDEGITKLSDAVSQDVDGFLSRMRQSVKLAKDYRAFGEASDGGEYVVNFIYRTEAID